MGKILIENLQKTYDGTNYIFNNLNLLIPDSSFTVILGPSGCGKSTLLRIISGLEQMSDGKMYIGDENVSNIPPKNRNIAMVFQNYALYPHMTVFGNVEYSLKIRGMKKEARQNKVNDALKIVGLEEHIKKRPGQLSGGQQQRVALARAIVKEPEVFLMDEPLSNLDAKLRNHMRETISDLHQKLQTTFVFVTHDQAEAMSLADNIILLDKGEIQQEGSPKKLYTDPNNLFVARFIGNPPTNIIQRNNYYIGIKPEDILLNINATDHTTYLPLSVELEDNDPQGSEIIYRVKTKANETLHIKSTNTWCEEINFNQIYIPLNAILFFDSNGQRIRDEAEIKKCLQEINP